jgi:acetyl/propionyl-CoA carboxylase alpha subunit
VKPRPIAKLLVANRSEIAGRIFRTCRAMGIATVAVYSDSDRNLPFVREAGEAMPIGGSTAADSYLRADAIIAAAGRAGADAVHPGYGFLAENADFARRCGEAGLAFIGPSPEIIASMGSKIEAKRIAEQAGVPVLPTAEVDGDTLPTASVERVGFPLLVKASAGGGGRGMRLVERVEDLAAAVDAARREAASAFGDGTIFLEPYVRGPRHVEIQIFGDTHGRVISLHERECSIQRRHQKIVEESPSPAVGSELRNRMGEAAIVLATAIRYIGAGTVEFILDERDRFFFLEVNTRLQVEHPVTEFITGLDLVRLQLEVAQGGRLPDPPPITGHAIEVRLYAEDPRRDWMPQTGRLTRLDLPEGPGLRTDAGFESGSEVGPNYDPMLTKVIAHAPTREEAARRLAAALAAMRIHGPGTNRDLLVRILRHPEFLAGRTDTGFLERHDPAELGAPLADAAAARIHAVAAALCGQAGRREAATAQRTLPSGWRNASSQLQHVAFECDAGRLEVAYRLGAGLRVDVDGEPIDITVESVSPDGCDLVLNGVRRRYLVERDGHTYHVDSSVGYTRVQQLTRFPATGPDETPGSLHAAMPGMVVRVLVEVGQHVDEGQEILVLEAMKMEHRILAPRAGTVIEITVAQGDSIAAGTLLAVVEGDADG